MRTKKTMVWSIGRDLEAPAMNPKGIQDNAKSLFFEHHAVHSRRQCIRFGCFSGRNRLNRLKRMRTFLKHCEGFYKCFKDEKQSPSEADFLKQIAHHFSTGSSLPVGETDKLKVFKRYLIRKANKGSARKGGGKGKSKDPNEDDIDDANDCNSS